MKSNIIELFTAETLTQNRCYDGIILLWPANSHVEIQHFSQTHTLSDQLYVINHNDVFQINKNEKTIMLYIASDWFKKYEYDFYNHLFNMHLIQSVKDIQKCMAILIIHYLKGTLNNELLKENVETICAILVKEALVSRDYMPVQLTPTVNNRYREILDYIHKNIDTKLTLDSVSKAFFTSKTSLSARFSEIFNIGFKKYIETLRIGLAMEYMESTEDTFSLISEKVGFGNSSLFTKKFKQYLSIKPSDYRKLTKLQKNIGYLLNAVQPSLSRKEKSSYIQLINDKLNNWQSEEESIIYIDDINPRFSPDHKFTIVVQIHDIDELKELLLENQYGKIFDFDNNALLLINISVFEIYQELGEDAFYLIFDTIANHHLNISFIVKNKKDISFIKNNLLTKKRFLNHPIYKALNKKEVNTSFTFSLEQFTLKEIYVEMLRVQDAGVRLDYNLDITYLFNHPENIKAVKKTLQRIGFKYYFIDNALLKYPYLEKEFDNLPIKQIAELIEIQSIMKRLQLDDCAYVLINIPNRNLLNNDINLLESTPLLIYLFMKFYRTLHGIGIDLREQVDGNAMYLYNKHDLKTTLYFLYQNLSKFKSFYFYEEKPYMVSEKEECLAVIVYDWRVIENEVYLNFPKSQSYNLGFKNKALRTNYLVTREIIDYKNANANEIISPDLLETYNCPNELINKIINVNYPRFNGFEHNFKYSVMRIDVDYNSLQLLSFYKKSLARDNKENN